MLVCLCYRYNNQLLCIGLRMLGACQARVWRLPRTRYLSVQWATEPQCNNPLSALPKAPPAALALSAVLCLMMPRQLVEGPFVALAAASLDVVPHAWEASGRTFPAQVPVTWASCATRVSQCAFMRASSPMLMHEFRAAVCPCVYQSAS